MPIAVPIFLAVSGSCSAATDAATPAATAEPTAAPATKAPGQTDLPSLHQTFADDFLVGAAVEPDLLAKQNHAALLTQHFNSLTAEDSMKPPSIEPTEGAFRWTNADKLIQFAKRNGLAAHGHTLVWHKQAAEWIFMDGNGKALTATPENKQLVLQRLEEYLRAVVGRYRDAVNVWDVVNEVVDEKQPDCLRRSKWYNLTGAEYIATAFRVADEMAPDAELILNNYDTTDPAKRECLYRLTGDLLAEGVPADGVGHQMHITIPDPPAADIEETILRFAEPGVRQHITELDASIYSNATDEYTIVPEGILVRTGYRYKELFEIFRRQAANIGSVTFRGLADDHTWLASQRIDPPLRFDDKLQAKPAYWGVVDPSKLPVPIGI